MRRLLFFLLGVLVMSSQLLAQNRTITGRVTDETGKAVFGASVVVKGSKTGAVTDEAGTFSLSVPADARTLVISGVGFTDREVTITGNTVNVQLTASVNDLENVVVTGYTRQTKTTFTGAASQIAGKAVENVPVGSFDQALQGRAPGLLVNSGSGQPGSSPNIIIRGVQSIQGAGAQPLYILDGVPISAADFQTLNPNDFESLNVLKDANSAALYGARGGTGVIVITTKRGKQGPTNFQARTQLGITMAPNFDRLNLMNTREILQYEEMMGLAGAPTNTPGWVYSKRNPSYATASPAEQARRDRLLDSISQINSDWSDILFRNGLSQNYEINASGGNEKTRFFLSGSHFNQEGIDLGSDLKRYTGRFNLDHTQGKFSAAWNNLIGFSNSNFSEGEWLGNSPRNPFQMIYRAKTYENPFNPDGTPRFGANTTLALRQVGNLLEGIQNSNWNQKQIKINTGLTLSYKLLPYLTLRNTTGVDVSSDRFQRFVRPNSYIGSLFQFQRGTLSEGYRSNVQLINTSGALFNQRFNDVHDVEAGAYFEVVRFWSNGLGFTLLNLDPRLGATGQGVGAIPVTGAYQQPASSASTQFAIRSYFATARYTYNNKYTINANIRRDGTSRIVNDNNNQITTWSAGVNWNVMRESFMDNQKFLTDFRVRASYGIIPNIGSIATGSYGITGGIFGVTNFTGAQVPIFGTTTYAGAPGISGQAPTSPGNPDLAIEKIKKTNIGVDLGAWRNRARLSIDAYNNRTEDLFVTNPLSDVTGFNSAVINAGVMTNKGLEFLLAVDVVKNNNWTVTVGGNHAINKNEIVDLGLVNEYFLGTFVIREGLPYGTHYTYNYLGADPATGRPIFETPNGGTTTDPAQAGQFAKFGTYLPKHVGGFNAEIRYKRFSIDALFSYQFDVVRSNNTRNWITRGTPGYHASVNASRELLTNQWMKPGDNKFFQSPVFDRGFTSSDLEDARFLRFRNLNVAYQIPEIRVGGTTLIRSARFYVQGQNLAIWSPWRGVDPEDSNNISLNEYPNPRMFVTGIDINF